jgi:uncharacterized protein YdiU (UPF0061 family)
MSDETSEQFADQAAAFQKVWTDSMSRIMQTALGAESHAPPPEVLKQIRGGIFQALAQSWDEFMRSPQFLESMKQWMDNAINFRKMTNDFMGKVRNEMQAPSRDDIDTVMLTVRHMEKRLLDRVEDLSAQVAALNQRLGAHDGKASKQSVRRQNKRSISRKPTTANRKGKA